MVSFIVNLIFYVILFFVYKAFYGFNIVENSIINLEHNIIYIALFSAVILMLKYFVFSIFKLKGNLVLSFLNFIFSIFIAYCNYTYILDFGIYNLSYFYTISSIIFFVYSVSHSYMDIYFLYKSDKLVKDREYRNNISHKIFNGLYIFVILIIFLLLINFTEISSYILSLLIIIFSVCVSNTFTERVAFNTNLKSNNILLILQIIFFIIGTALIISYFIYGRIIEFYVGLIFIMSLGEFLYIYKYKINKN